MPVYLDHAATSPLRQEALEAMLPILRSTFGNPSSPHVFGRRARTALDEARESVARDLGADPREVVFTSGGSESINLAIKGAAWAGKARGHRIITSAVEHDAVLNSCRYLERFGFEVVVLPADRYGRVDPDELAASLTDHTILVTVQAANNEVGTLQPVAEIARRVRTQGHVLLHVDAVQAAPWMDLDVAAMDVDLLSIAGHKLEGPKGTGVLVIRRGTTLLAQQHGGSQERHRRAGTEDVAGAVGLATALRLAREERSAALEGVREMRDRLRDGLLAIGGVEQTGHPRDRLPNHLSAIVRDADGQDIVQALDLEGVACSTGSACTTGSTDPSHVLTAMGYPPEEARGALRLTAGRTTTRDDVAFALGLLPGVVGRARATARSRATDPFVLEGVPEAGG